MAAARTYSLRLKPFAAAGQKNISPHISHKNNNLHITMQNILKKIWSVSEMLVFLHPISKEEIPKEIGLRT